MAPFSLFLIFFTPIRFHRTPFSIDYSRSEKNARDSALAFWAERQRDLGHPLDDFETSPAMVATFFESIALYS